ncbi:MAG: hypothetical protein K0R39_2992 [Symbiobacteriaceae bacterium]|jgi:hypothetical protein|nr:hypothetical protein [Symbiobacteriaceae bacterium]
MGSGTVGMVPPAQSFWCESRKEDVIRNQKYTHNFAFEGVLPCFAPDALPYF